MAEKRIKGSRSVAPPDASLGSSRSPSAQRYSGSARLQVESTTHADFAMDTRFLRTTSKPHSCCFPLPLYRSTVSSSSPWHCRAPGSCCCRGTGTQPSQGRTGPARCRQLAPLRDGPIVRRSGPGDASLVVRAEHAGEVVDECVEREHM